MATCLTHLRYASTGALYRCKYNRKQKEYRAASDAIPNQLSTLHPHEKNIIEKLTMDMLSHTS